MDRLTSRGLIQTINAAGFREWHSYELARSFGYLGLGVVMLVCGLAIMEGVFESSHALETVFKLFLTFFSLCFTGWCWLMFIHILMRAEEIGRQAVCPNCQRYGRLQVLTSDVGTEPTHRQLHCRCIKCGQHWDITYTVQSKHVRF